MNSKEFAEKICNLLKEHKAESISLIDVKEKSSVADYFVVASGRSMTHTRALGEHVDEEMGKIGESPIRSEGLREGRWAVLDYGDVLVHLFNDETKQFYNLERLWDNGNNITKF